MEYIANGAAKLDEINEMIGLNLESDDYDSIAGHIINLLEHLPEEGETIVDDFVEYKVANVEKIVLKKFIFCFFQKKKENLKKIQKKKLHNY